MQAGRVGESCMWGTRNPSRNSKKIRFIACAKLATQRWFLDLNAPSVSQQDHPLAHARQMKGIHIVVP
jgi:hypothetical protein